jgi:thiol:disulfide interchange protein DsbD
VAFSAAFASPFFLLALFPTMLRQHAASRFVDEVCQSGHGLYGVVAAAVEFLRSGESGWLGAGDIFGYPLCMALYVALCVAWGSVSAGCLPFAARSRNARIHLRSASVVRIDVPWPGSLSSTRIVFTLDAEEVPRKEALFAAVDSFLLDEPGAKSSAKKNSLEDQPWLSSLSNT